MSQIKAYILFLLYAFLIVFPKVEKMDEKLCFYVDWEDSVSGLTRKFTLNFYPSEKSVEMYESRNKKMFLRKTVIDGLYQKDFYVGNTINVFSRMLKITEFGDQVTQNQCVPERQSTFAMVKPDGMSQLGLILTAVHEAGFVVARAKMTQLNELQAGQFYNEHRGRSFYPELVSYMASGPVLAMELIRSDAVYHWRLTLGPTDSNEARTVAPDSIRAKFGRDKTNNACHGSDSQASADRELAFFFPPTHSGKESPYYPAPTSTFHNSTCCVIKPHALADGVAGQIIEDIVQAGFAITGLHTFHLDYGNAEEFYEIYRGIVEDYTPMVKQLSSGQVMALEISGGGDQIVSSFRQLVGPADPELARKLRPKSLRAKFGKTTALNAIHCTDLPEDGLLEVEYFFKILQ